MKAFSLVGECAEKSELVRRLVVEFVGRGLRVSTIKRVSDAIDLERHGSGTWKHRAAGASEVMIASASRFALLHEMPAGTVEPDVGDLLAQMTSVDLVLLDGFKRSDYPKMEVVPAGRDAAVLAPHDTMILAITADVPIAAHVPHFPLSEIGALADFALAHAREAV
jgi:molybdopterin-guanine dinucleotide biosynthesis protein B